MGRKLQREDTTGDQAEIFMSKRTLQSLGMDYFH